MNCAAVDGFGSVMFRFFRQWGPNILLAATTYG